MATGSGPSRDIHPDLRELRAVGRLQQPTHLDPNRHGLIEIAVRAPQSLMTRAGAGLVLPGQRAQRLECQGPVAPEQLADHSGSALGRRELPGHGCPFCTGTR